MKRLHIQGSGSIVKIYTYINGTMPQAGIDPPVQSHASYEASALPPSHHGWIWPTSLSPQQKAINFAFFTNKEIERDWEKVGHILTKQMIQKHILTTLTLIRVP